MTFSRKMPNLFVGLFCLCLCSLTSIAKDEVTKSWSLEAEQGDTNVGLNGVVETDSLASGKQAVVAKVGRNLPKLFHRPLYKGPCSMSYPFGEYEAIFRMKTKDIKSNKPLVRIELRKEGSRYNEPALKSWEFKPCDFKKADQYQDFKIRFDHVPLGWLQLHVVWLGEADFTFDRYTLRLIRQFGSDELARRWPYSPINTELGPDGCLNVLLLKGPLYQYQRIEQALADTKEAKIYDAFMQMSYVFWDYSLDGYFPDINEHWYGLDVAVLGGIDAEALGLKRRRRIAEFVANCGGGLLMLPGPYSFGKGRYNGSAIEKVLPVNVGTPWDWKKFTAPEKIEPTGELTELTQGLKFDSPPYTLWYTQVTLRPGSHVILKAGDKPILVVSDIGKGRSAAILALPCGQWDKAQTPFWQWDDWTVLMKRLIIWLGKGENK